MRHALAFLFLALFWTGQAVAQVALPQTVNPPNVPSGLDANGNFTSRQIQFPLDLSFSGLYGQPTTSSTQAEINLGDVQIILDSDPGFQNDYTVQITPSGEYGPMMIGTIKSLDTSSGQTLLTIHVTRAIGGGIFTNWNIAVIGGPNVTVSTGTAFSATANGSAALGMKMTLGNPGAFPYSSSAIGVGSQMVFTVPAGQNFPPQAHLKIDDYQTPNNHYDANVVAYSGTNLIASVTAAYGTGTSSSAWRISRVVGPQTRISLYQMNQLQMSGIGSSTLTINKGSIRDSTDTIDLFYNGGTISFVSGSSDVVAVAGPGTITSSGGTNLSGSGTAFTTTFSTAGTLTDLNNQLTALNLATVSFPTVISSVTSSRTVSVIGITNNTFMSLNAGLAASGDTYTRGGIKTVFAALGVVYGIVLTYNTANGTTKIVASSFTKTGAPDLPSGYSYYRVIGYVGMNTNTIQAISQPLATNALTTAGDIPYFGQVTSYFSTTYQTYLQRLPIGSNGQALTVQSGLPAWGGPSTSPTAVYSATITPTTISGSVSSVNTGTGVITWSTNHGLTTGQCIRGVGTVPTGFTVGQMFYMNALSANTFALYTTLANALADTSRVTLSSSTTGATVVDLVYSNVFSVGFSAVAPICGTPGTTTVKFDYNITNPLAAANGMVNFLGYSLIDSGAVQRKAWWASGTAASTATPPFTFSSTTLVQQNQAVSDGDTLLGNWAQQGTTPFIAQVWINGALDEPIPANDNDLLERAVA